ncbi:CehA/McbA family metallohydrolase [Candidatus Contubernalis alkaliaceticus]|uniref:CehA/McbA family metallohydrolase n=1 Tax=Candidatus Contubernalis alkaliaceticus TaxID=338645 RepID=UPI001F4C500D|nr:CehA/McbA family metallohydrolase [Candidatus Contubernalis alkalaceticus]UNC93653.1 CehA/McbA family metallohydrolase [Candidatus Contubernalis alkalaceticus]
MHEYAGSIHVHSTYSDGSGTVEEIASAAQKACLDFVMITDHETLHGLFEEKDGWYKNTLVLIDTELNREDHHYLAFNLKEEISARGLTPQELIDRVNQLGGIGFIAHPFEKGAAMILNGKNYPWTSWHVRGFNGIEIWNYTSQCRDGAANLFKLYWSAFFKGNANVNRPDPKALKKWDQLLSDSQRVLAIGGTDAHAIKVKRGPFRFVLFPYQFLFNTINTHLLSPLEFTGKKEVDQNIVYSALQAGHFFTANNKVYPPRGFSFTAENQNEQVIQGDSIKNNKNTVLAVKSPTARSLIRIIKDGKVVSESSSNRLCFKVLGKGSFRVEVYYRPHLRRMRPWIYSNPIFVE